MSGANAAGFAGVSFLVGLVGGGGVVVEDVHLKVRIITITFHTETDAQCSYIEYSKMYIHIEIEVGVKYSIKFTQTHPHKHDGSVCI